VEEKYMQIALEEARMAEAQGEVPVGCVIVCGDRVVGRGHNLRESRRNALLHAEIIAINEACETVGSWRLGGCELYVTLEPCPMCAGAIINARIDTVVYGASDTTFGACGGVMNLFEEAFGMRPRLYGGVLRQECESLMKDFFRGLRNGEKAPAEG